MYFLIPASVLYSITYMNAKILFMQRSVVIIKKNKWWECPSPNAGGIYKINPALLGGLCGGLIALLITLFIR